MALSVPSFAKINWDLRILGRRPDGFHELDTVFQTVDLADTLDFEAADGGVRLEIEGRELPCGEENLVVRAARRFLEAASLEAGIRIRLTKRIPIAAGLGGGSSNAAVTLMALYRIFGSLEESRLGELAAALGSDCAFFLTGGLAWGRGRGEVVRELPDEGLSIPVLLVWPGFPSSTADAYRRLLAEPVTDLTKARTDHKMRGFSEILKSANWWILRNDLEEPVLGELPALAALKRGLVAHGCDWAMLSGSGSVVFAVGSPSGLLEAAEWCREFGVGEAILTRTLSRSEYRARLSANISGGRG